MMIAAATVTVIDPGLLRVICFALIGEALKLFIFFTTLQSRH